MIKIDMINAFYDNVDPRRKQENRDARMISEDHNAIANLADKPIYRTFDANRFQEHLSMFDQDER